MAGPVKLHFAAPFFDFFVVSTEENVRHAHVFPDFGSGVMGTIEQAVVGEAVEGGAVGVSEYAREKAGDAVDEDESSEFASGEDIVTDRYFVVDVAFDDSLVYAFVSATEEDQVVEFGEFFCERLIPDSALWAEIDDLGGGVHAVFGGGDCACDGFGFHDHAGATAERGVVGYFVFVESVIADVGYGEIYGPGCGGPLHHGGIQVGGYDFGEKGQDFKVHRVGFRWDYFTGGDADLTCNAYRTIYLLVVFIFRKDSLFGEPSVDLS